MVEELPQNRAPYPGYVGRLPAIVASLVCAAERSMRGDHRLTMVGAVAGLSSREGVDLRGAEAVETSFPGFFRVLAQLSTV